MGFNSSFIVILVFAVLPGSSHSVNEVVKYYASMGYIIPSFRVTGNLNFEVRHAWENTLMSACQLTR
jgi:hypothetical protein